MCWDDVSEVKEGVSVVDWFVVEKSSNGLVVGKFAIFNNQLIRA